MGDVQFQFTKGLNTASPETQLGADFLRRAEHLYFSPTVNDQPVVAPGRSPLTTSLPVGVDASNIRGLQYLQYDAGASVMVLYANGRLYEAAVGSTGLTLGAWTEVKDLQAVPVFIPRTGPFLKALPIGDDRWVLFTGIASERPLLRDRDGNWRYMGLKKPTAMAYPTPGSMASALLGTTSVASTVRPNSNSTPGTTQFGVPTSGFDNPNYAQDGLTTTQATKRRTTAGLVATDWALTGATTTSNTILSVKLGSSSLPPDGSGEGLGGGGESTPESLSAYMYVQVSVNGGGAFTSSWSGLIPVSARTVQVAIPNGVAYNQIVVRVMGRYISGTASVDFQVEDIWIQSSTAGGGTAITEGTYYYAITEYFSQQMADGRTYYVESAPSDTIQVDVVGVVYGIKLTFASAANSEADGVKNDPTAAPPRLLGRKVYRSSSTGVYPDLGIIANAAIADTSFTDTFTVLGTDLGPVSVYTVTTENAVIPAAGLPPAFQDATVFGGSLVAIPISDTSKIQWSLPGQTEYWPLPAHDIRPSPTAHNDGMRGIVTLNDSMLLFYRTRVVRLRDLPFVSRPVFDVAGIKFDTIAPNQGMAGGPFGYTLFENSKGRGMCAWASDSGLWMSDATLVSERGMGVMEATKFLNWHKEVGRSRIEETRLSFDSSDQVIFLDYFDSSSVKRCITFHTADGHWIPSAEDQLVPKMAGGHESPLDFRTVGEGPDGTIRHWSLSLSRLALYNERTGTSDGTNPFQIHLETGWGYFAGPLVKLWVRRGVLYHGDWGPSASCDLDLLFRNDRKGVIQNVNKRGLSLMGNRGTEASPVHRSGWCVKAIIRAQARTNSDGSLQLSLGPLVLDGGPMGEV